MYAVPWCAQKKLIAFSSSFFVSKSYGPVVPVHVMHVFSVYLSYCRALTQSSSTPNNVTNRHGESTFDNLLWRMFSWHLLKMSAWYFLPFTYIHLDLVIGKHGRGLKKISHACTSVAVGSWKQDCYLPFPMSVRFGLLDDHYKFQIPLCINRHCQCHLGLLSWCLRYARPPKFSLTILLPAMPRRLGRVLDRDD